MHIRTQEPLKARKNKREVKSRHLESTNYDVINDATPDGDVTNPDINKTVAETLEVQKHFAQSRIRPIGGLLRVCNMTFTKITLLLVIVISVFGCLFNIKLSERKSTVGNSSSLRLSELLTDHFRKISFHSAFCSWVNILGINKELCPCMMTEMGWNHNKRLKRRREILHNTRIRDEGGYWRSGYSHSYFYPRLLRAVITATTDFFPKSDSRVLKLIFCKKKQQITRDGIIFKIMIVNDVNIFRPVTAPPWLRNLRSVNVCKGTFLAGKCLGIYLCLFADFWASSVYYLDIYKINFELEDNFRTLYDLIYLYIYMMFIVRGHLVTGQHSLQKFS